MWCQYCDDVNQVYAILRFPRPFGHEGKRILDAQYFAHVLGKETEHVVARLDLTDVASMENDHGNVCDDDIMTLAPPGAKEEIFELLHNPDEKHLTETDEVYLHRTFWEAQYVIRELKAQQKAREQAES